MKRQSTGRPYWPLLTSDTSPYAVEMVGGVAHEISNVLQPIMFHVAELTRRSTHSLLPAEVAELNESVGHLEALVRDLREFANGQAPAAERNGLESVVGIGLRLCRARIRKLGVEVYCDCDPDAAVPARRGHVVQVVLNLLLNALNALEEASPSAPRLSLRSGRSERHAFVEVIDNGPGIPEDLQGAIFEPHTRRGGHAGQGLGMSICRSIVRSHGGELSLAASRPGETVFRLELPQFPDRKHRGLRRDPRRQVRWSAMVVSERGRESCTVMDLSAGGAFLAGEPFVEWSPGLPIHLEVLNPELDELSRISGSIRWNGPSKMHGCAGLGVAFDSRVQL